MGERRQNLETILTISRYIYIRKINTINIGQVTHGSAQSATAGETSVGPLCVRLFVFTEPQQIRGVRGAQASSVDISGSHSSQTTFHEIGTEVGCDKKESEEYERKKGV